MVEVVEIFSILIGGSRDNRYGIDVTYINIQQLQMQKMLKLNFYSRVNSLYKSMK
jgi:hypothetical protein